MKKRILGALAMITLLVFPLAATAERHPGQVHAKSKDIDITMFGSAKVLPHFIVNADFNSDDTMFDRIGCENGYISEHSVRN